MSKKQKRVKKIDSAAASRINQSTGGENRIQTEKMDKRQLHREAASRSERISTEFALLQAKVRDESDHLGYFEVDDEYLDGVAEMQEYSKELCKDQDRTFKFYDPDRCEPAEELCSVK